MEQFVDRERELAALEDFWALRTAQLIPVWGRRRVGKTKLLERFAGDKRSLYYRCTLTGTEEQLTLLGRELAAFAEDPVLQAEPPTTWEAVFALIQRLAERERLLLVLDELPYWVVKDERVPSILQNWWDAKGRYLNIMLVLCGSALQMMEGLMRGDAPRAGCQTGRVVIRQMDLHATARMLPFKNPVDVITAYCLLGGIPFYQEFFQPEKSPRANVLAQIVNPSARLYEEPRVLFATHHAVINAEQALLVLRLIARGNHRWSDIRDKSKLVNAQFERISTALIGDTGLVERVLPVTEQHESRSYYTQYHLSDNFLAFWFTFVEPNQGHIEFGDREAVVDAVFHHLPTFLGAPFEALCRDWTRRASAGGGLPPRLSAVGRWWTSDHEIDVVGLDSERQVTLVGECKYQNGQFGYDDLRTYLGHVAALTTAKGVEVAPEALHVLFSRSGFAPKVLDWAATAHAALLSPADLLLPYGELGKRFEQTGTVAVL